MSSRPPAGCSTARPATRRHSPSSSHSGDAEVPMYLDAFGLAGGRRRRRRARRDRRGHRAHDVRVHPALRHRLRLRPRRRLPRTLPRGGRPLRQRRPAAHDPRARRPHARRPRRCRRRGVQLHHAAALLAQRRPGARRRGAARRAPGRHDRPQLPATRRGPTSCCSRSARSCARCSPCPGSGRGCPATGSATRLAWQVNRLDPHHVLEPIGDRVSDVVDLAQPEADGADLGRRRRRAALLRRRSTRPTGGSSRHAAD